MSGGLEAQASPPAASADGYEVFRPYGAAGGLKDEFEQLAAEHPDITKLVTIGQTVRGEDIVALKVSRHASRIRDGRRPATLYVGGQHGREWISPETVRRLAHHVVDGYRTDRALTDLIDTTELWFVPVANPDGYDFSFTPGNRLWRKNLRDNDGDGLITAVDGVDPNRNYPTKWGYDDEGSSPDAGSEAYRGTGPASEPETRAVDGLMARVGFEFLVNYHSAAEGVLYGTGWQVATPTPDDALYEALVGDQASPAVPGYLPGLTADLYSGNGILDEHAHIAYGTLGVLVEMSQCQTVASADPADEWDPADCTSAFHFPDDEALVEAEFRKNLPFALSIAQSAADPADPVTVTGRQAPEFVVDSFDVSYGDPQTVAVTARRDQHTQRLEYRVNGGRTRRAHIREWKGGERYGDERDRYYAEFRGEVKGTRPGDSVEVWFTARRDRRHVESEHFTYTVASDSGADALILASEDYTGVNPTYPAGTAGPKYVDEYAAALDANDITHATWDVDAQGVPHPARRAEPLRRRGVGDGRRPAGARPRGRAHRHVPVRPRPRHRRRRAPAVPDAGAARLPQRGRQARPSGREHAVPRPARPVARRHLLRARRGAGTGLRHHPRLPGRLPAAVRRLRPVLPRCEPPRHVRPARRHRRPRPARRGDSRVRWARR